MSNLKVLLSLSILSMSICASAQNTVIYSSIFLKPGDAVPAKCQAQADVLRAVEPLYPHPAKWTWFIICDEPSWNSFLVHASIDSFGKSFYGETAIDSGVTYLRGTTLIEPDDIRMMPEHVIAHELARIMLQSHDNAKVETTAVKWMQLRKQFPSLLVAATTPATTNVSSGN